MNFLAKDIRNDKKGRIVLRFLQIAVFIVDPGASSPNPLLIVEKVKSSG